MAVEIDGKGYRIVPAPPDFELLPGVIIAPRLPTKGTALLGEMSIVVLPESTKDIDEVMRVFLKANEKY